MHSTLRIITFRGGINKANVSLGRKGLLKSIEFIRLWSA
jgi:hypothetical protein